MFILMHFHTGSLKINIFKEYNILEGREGVTKNSTLDNVDKIMDNPVGVHMVTTSIP